MKQHDTNQFARHVGLPRLGAEGQAKIISGHVMVIGLGGLGAAAGLYLASSGVGFLTINDFDRIDATNLPRQILFRAGDVGEYKTEVTRSALQAVNPALEIVALNQRLDEKELLQTTDNVRVVLDCTDNFASRMLINRICHERRTPLISGAAIRFEGQVAVFRHDKSGMPCYSCLYTDRDDNLENCAGQGILAPVAGTIGCMMATEALKVLTGLCSDLERKVWIYDGLAGTSQTIAIAKRPDCPVCRPDRPGQEY